MVSQRDDRAEVAAVAHRSRLVDREHACPGQVSLVVRVTAGAEQFRERRIEAEAGDRAAAEVLGRVEIQQPERLVVHQQHSASPVEDEQTLVHRV